MKRPVAPQCIARHAIWRMFQKPWAKSTCYADGVVIASYAFDHRTRICFILYAMIWARHVFRLPSFACLTFLALNFMETKKQWRAILSHQNKGTSTSSSTCTFRLAGSCMSVPDSSSTTVTTAPTCMKTAGEAPVPNPKGQQWQRYQLIWRDASKWFVYDVSVDRVFCETWHAACKMNVFLPNTSRDKDSNLMFVKNYFYNLKKALGRFQSHEASNLHCAT